MDSQERILITGMGICSPIGNTLQDVACALLEGQSGVREIGSFDSGPMRMKLAGEVEHIPGRERYREESYRIWDRGTRMAIYASDEALLNARLDVEQYGAGRIGVCCGTSGSGQYQNARFRLDRSLPIDPKMVFYLSRNSPHFQSSQVALQFGIQGPNLAIGSATAGSGIALLTGMNWLRSGKVDAVLVGGAESFSLLNVYGFDRLGLSAEGRCTPFSGTAGMTFGEGAAYIVLERESDALARGATIHAHLSGAAVTADGYDPILFDPSGEGQARAMRAAMNDANCEPDSISWIKASGTGGRDQDLAESLAIRETFGSPPPVSSIEPYIGHANGAGPMLGLVSSVLCMQQNFIPPILGYEEPRSGCDLDYVSNGTRFVATERVLCNTAAFGGVNCASIIEKHRAAPRISGSKRPTSSQARPEPHAEPKHPVFQAEEEDADQPLVVISGVGIVSSIGCGNLDALASHEEQEQAYSLRDHAKRFSGTAWATETLETVHGFSAKKLCPSIPLRGIDRLTQYAAAAVNIALEDAKLRRNSLNLNRVGVVSALARSSGDVFAQLFHELQADSFSPSVGRLMLRNGRFMLASQLAHWFGLRGPSCSISLGAGCGLHAMATAQDQLNTNPELDAIVVVASDELSPFLLEYLDTGGVLARQPGTKQLYAGQSQTFVPGEAAVSIILERSSTCRRREQEPLAAVRSSYTNFDGQTGTENYDVKQQSLWEVRSDEQLLMRCIEQSVSGANLVPENISLVAGNGCGVGWRDTKEMKAVSRSFPNPPAYECLNSLTGFCESSSSLLNLAAAVRTLRGSGSCSRSYSHTEEFTFAKCSDDITANPHALVVASTEQGHNAAAVLGLTS